MPLKVKLWGVRGSIPSPQHPEVVKALLKDTIDAFTESGIRDSGAFIAGLGPAKAGGYGGNTTCVQVSTPEVSLILDAGSGIRGVGDEMMQGPCGVGHGEVHLFFTHFHWDHLIGLPFFAPIFVPGNKIHIYAVQPELEDCIRQIFRKPFFPVPFEALGSTIVFHRLEPRKPLQIGNMTVTPYKLDHPDPCWGYRIESGGRSYAHCVDTECTRVSAAEIGLDLPLYTGADLLLFDAQYTVEEAVERRNWGHSASLVGIDLAIRENIKHILFAHHDPGALDAKILDAEEQTAGYVEACRLRAKIIGQPALDFKWEFAREGQVIVLE